ncbi:unnamed protein product [Bemisia tabaci]|uniref:Uncharacterized protein n=1 Tax=Bemisia tabaci TaxID=7038 RepID=A0A9P0AHY6_BEMTA|nr:unnamed protein product [Bemisia tabaci]
MDGYQLENMPIRDEEATISPLTPRERLKKICQCCIAGDWKTAKLYLNGGVPEESRQQTCEATISRQKIIQYILSSDFTNPLSHVIYDLTISGELDKGGSFLLETGEENCSCGFHDLLAKDHFRMEGKCGQQFQSSSFFSIPNKFVLIQIPITQTRIIELRLLACRKKSRRTFAVRDLGPLMLLNEDPRDKTTIEFLMKHVTNKKARVAEPLLYVASKMGEARIVKVLLESGVTANIRDSEIRSTPLHLATKIAAEMVVDLLIRYGADLNCTDIFGRTPLHYAATNGWTRGTEILLRNGATVDESDNNETTPLKFALEGGHSGVADLLIQHGANFDLQEYFDKMPSLLQLFVEKGDAQGVKLMLDIALVTATKSESASCCDRNSEGPHQNRLQVSRVKSRTTPFPLDTGICPISERHIQTAFESACRMGKGDVVHVLLHYGADVDGTGVITPLHDAVDYGRKEVVEILLNHGADIEILERDFYSAVTIVVLSERDGRTRPEVSYSKTAHILMTLRVHGADFSTLAGASTANCGRKFTYSPEGLEAALEIGFIREPDLIHLLQHRIRFHDEHYHKSKSLESTPMNILGQYVVKLQAAGLLSNPVLKDNSGKAMHLNKLVTRAERFSPALREKCEVEVLKLKRVILNRKYNFLELLFLSPDQLVELCRKESFQKSYRRVMSWYDEFPLYWLMLWGRVLEGDNRRRLVDSACRICHLMFNWESCETMTSSEGVRIPFEVSERVVDCLGDRDLKRFVFEHERDPVWRGLSSRFDDVKLPANRDARYKLSIGCK